MHIHDIPSLYAHADFIEKIGNYVGNFIKADPNNFGGTWRSYFRIRVTLSLKDPLKRKMKIRMRDGTAHWVSFKYERMNIFCFCCGMLGHSDAFCRKAYEEGIEPKDNPYGSWMRAGTKRQTKPVGAKWLLADLPSQPVFVPSTSAPPLTDPIRSEDAIVVHVDLKTRREEKGVVDQVLAEDVTMSEVPKNLSVDSKNLCSAGLDSKARHAQ